MRGALRRRDRAQVQGRGVTALTPCVHHIVLVVHVQGQRLIAVEAQAVPPVDGRQQVDAGQGELVRVREGDERDSRCRGQLKRRLGSRFC